MNLQRLFLLLLSLTALLAPAQDTAEDQYYLGSMAYYEERFDDAAKHFRAALAADPNDGFATAYLGATLLKLGDKDSALDLLNKGIAMLPPDNTEYEAWARDQITDVLLAKKDTIAALANMKKILDLPLGHDQQLDMSVRYGTYYYKLGQADRALELFRQLVDWYPDSYEARAGLAAALNAKKDYEASIKEWTKAVELTTNDDDRFDAVFNRTKTYINKGDYSLATFDALTILNSDFSYGTALLDIIAYYDEPTVGKLLRESMANGNDEHAKLIRDALADLQISATEPAATATQPTTQPATAQGSTAPAGQTDIAATDTGGDDSQQGTVMPSYPGGSRALRRFIKDNLVYPEEAEKAGLQETVVLNCHLDDAGRVVKVEIARCQNQVFAEEAKRVASMLHFFPAKVDGTPVGAIQQVEIPFLIRRGKK